MHRALTGDLPRVRWIFHNVVYAPDYAVGRFHAEPATRGGSSPFLLAARSCSVCATHGVSIVSAPAAGRILERPPVRHGRTHTAN